MILRFLFFFFLIVSLSAVEKAHKKTVCLNMIVKDEKDVIARCIKSALPIIDRWVIVDTGSTDGTQKIIREVLKGIPGELHERPWVNFGHNRQEALLLAKDKADYILFMDADDVLVFSEDFQLPELTKDFYSIPTDCKGAEWYFQRLVKANLDWGWEGVVHEDLRCKNSAQGEILSGVRYVCSTDGARAKDPNRWKKDIQLLEQAIKKDPENPRNFFYLARSYMSAELHGSALEYFEKRARMGGDAEELFTTNLAIGKLRDKLHFDFKIVESAFIKTYLSRPYRAEPLFYLSCKLFERSEYEKAYKIVCLALKLPSNVVDFLSFEKWIYDFGLLFQLAICAEHTGHYSEGIEACERLLKRTDLREETRFQIENHLETMQQANVKQIKNEFMKLFKIESSNQKSDATNESKPLLRRSGMGVDLRGCLQSGR